MSETDTNRENLRTMVRGYYDIQKIRIATGNRIFQNFRHKLGLESSEKEVSDAKAAMVLNAVRADYKRITDGIVKRDIPLKKNFKPAAIISEYAELLLVNQYIKIEEADKRMVRDIGIMLEGFPIYTEYLEGIKGIGPMMAGVIITEIRIDRAKYASSIWKYAGLDVAADGRGRSKKKEHLVTAQYKNKDGKDAERLSITFNPFLKTKLIGVLASSFLRAGDNPYKDIYASYKFRLENSPEHAEKTKGHRHNMALRYMVKQFLADLYGVWRKMEGLPVFPPYSEAKLGLVHNSPGQDF